MKSSWEKKIELRAQSVGGSWCDTCGLSFAHVKRAFGSNYATMCQNCYDRVHIGNTLYSSKKSRGLSGVEMFDSCYPPKPLG